MRRHELSQISLVILLFACLLGIGGSLVHLTWPRVGLTGVVSGAILVVIVGIWNPGGQR